MIVLSFPAETADRIVSGEQTVVTYPQPILWYRKEWADRDVALSSLIFQPVAVARQPEVIDLYRADGAYYATQTIPGAIVGSATVAAVVPIVGPLDDATPPLVQRSEKAEAHALIYLEAGRLGFTNLTDQLPFADFTPGRLAVIFDRASLYYNHDQPVTISYDHPGPISEWVPR